MRIVRSAPDAGATIDNELVYTWCPDGPSPLLPNAVPSTPGGDVIAQLLACPPRPRRRNNHLSVSRLQLLEQCGLAYYRRYIEKLDSDEEAVPADFGVLLHEVLETTMQWVVDSEFTGQISEQQVLETYRALWPKYASLIGVELYQEGARIVREYIRRHGRVDHFKILAVELEFNLKLEEFVVNGYMDRVDKVNDTTVRIIDYKSSWTIFSREEVDSSLQMSVYALAAKDIWPWAETIELEFQMIRHNVELKTSRTESQLGDARDYVLLMGRHAETAEEFPPRLNMNCATCDYRRICPEYLRALEGKIEKVAYTEDDLESVALAQQQAAKLAKIFYARKKETEDILRVAIEQQQEVTAGGAIFRLIKQARDKTYPIDKTIAVLKKFAGVTEEFVREEFVRVDTTRLDRWVEKQLPDLKSSATAKTVEMQLDLAAEKTYGHRFDAQPIKGGKKNLKAAPKSGSLPETTEGST